MKIQRISFDMTPHNLVSQYERSRISLMGSHIERLLFYYGLNEFEIPNCNFIHFAVNGQETISGYKIPSGEGVDKIVSINLLLDINIFFELKLKDQPKFILDQILHHLNTFLKVNNLESEILKTTYEKILLNDFYIPFSKSKSKNKTKKIIATPFTKWLYDSINYKLIVEKENKKSSFKLCTLSPISIPAEHPNESRDNYISFPSVDGWIDDNTFRLTCGHKEFNFLMDKMKVQTIEHEELKTKYINWDSVN